MIGKGDKRCWGASLPDPPLHSTGCLAPHRSEVNTWPLATHTVDNLDPRTSQTSVGLTAQMDLVALLHLKSAVSVGSGLAPDLGLGSHCSGHLSALRDNPRHQVVSLWDTLASSRPWWGQTISFQRTSCHRFSLKPQAHFLHRAAAKVAAPEQA